MTRRRRLVLGLGDPRARENGFGGAVVATLRRWPELAGGADVREAGPDLLADSDTFHEYDELVLVDTVPGGERPGEVTEVGEAEVRQWPHASPGCPARAIPLAIERFRARHPAAATRIRLVALQADALRAGAAVPPAAITDAVATIADGAVFDGAARPFQTCGSCRVRWKTWHHFVLDPRVRLLGLQAVPMLPDSNLLIFEHGCGSSVSILTRRLHALLPEDDGRVNWPSLRATEDCPGRCRSLADFSACTRRCRNARDRDLIAIVQRLRRLVDSPSTR